LDRYGTGPLSFGAAYWIPGVKTAKAAKKRRKNEQKWARYSHLKRVRVADLFLMDRYLSTGSASSRNRRPWAASTPLATEVKHEIQLPQHEQELGEGKTRWLGLGGSVDIDEGSFTLGLGLRAEPDLKHGVSHACDTFGTSGPLTPQPTFEIDALEVWAVDGVVSRTLRQRAAAEAGMMDRKLPRCH